MPELGNVGLCSDMKQVAYCLVIYTVGAFCLMLNISAVGLIFQFTSVCLMLVICTYILVTDAC